MNFTTPKTISDHITAFCKEIDPTEEPLYVSLQFVSEAKINFCYPNVRSYIALNAGGIQHGWIIWESLDVLEAEFHAVWVSPVGEFIDITPKADGENEILFLPDSKRVYRNHLIENRKKPLVYTKATWSWMWDAHQIHRIKQRHFRHGEVDAQAASAELDKFLDSQEEGSTPDIKPNASCLCGSGKKFKKCCSRFRPVQQ